ncbi:MAG: tRNA preQ1(34) S-adenosylmethionine ribosyltransferase-isomerase QueA [Peptococcaceae bacterium]|jgi:S-adenosylmethionine:tRNA ribosyltransferase-isomerase|nr:tRNA preQ1(34) S-adenosylmethionine ribosyltransferase-isomerase QueA [Peptococcaceae bacterium]
MKLEDFDYDLPKELIAQNPVEPRDSSRLMVVNRSKKTVVHSRFNQLIEFLKPGDVLVLNKTKVLPARIIGQKEQTNARIEILLLRRISQDVWEILVKPARRLKIGQKVIFGEGLLVGELVSALENGNRIMQFYYEGLFEQVLDRLGEMPLPPYITSELKDKDRYQTVYAQEIGSAAAPTAGLHFTEELLDKINKHGVDVLSVVLHVGLGTFRPVKTENIENHQMHSEYFFIDQETADKINRAKKEGRRIIAVGTTVVRTLESAANLSSENEITPMGGWTDIFIYPGYKFKIIDALITNFHFPRSTLIMLVSAFAGRELIFKAYDIAIKEGYRFFSFGDAMLIK